MTVGMWTSIQNSQNTGPHCVKLRTLILQRQQRTAKQRNYCLPSNFVRLCLPEITHGKETGEPLLALKSAFLISTLLKLAASSWMQTEREKLRVFQIRLFRFLILLLQ